MKYIFIINSFTLKDEINKVIKKIKMYAEDNYYDYEIEINNIDNKTENIVKKYKMCNYVIIAVGGDGMLNRVLNSLINTNNILGFIPCGTGNDFYRSALKEFTNLYNECDVIKINNRYFINVACFGIDADVANNKDLIKSKLIPKSQRYNVSVINSFIKYKPRRFLIKLNKEKIKGDFVTVVICNGGFYGSGYNISPNYQLNNNLFDVYVVEDANKLNIMKMLFAMKNGKHEKYKRVHKYQTNKLTLLSDVMVSCNIDGEILKAKKYNVEIINKKVTIYFNRDLINFVTGKNKKK